MITRDWDRAWVIPNWKKVISKIYHLKKKISKDRMENHPSGRGSEHWPKTLGDGRQRWEADMVIILLPFLKNSLCLWRIILFLFHFILNKQRCVEYLSSMCGHLGVKNQCHGIYTRVYTPVYTVTPRPNNQTAQNSQQSPLPVWVLQALTYSSSCAGASPEPLDWSSLWVFFPAPPQSKT
jgi:hypothetical protein